MKELRIGGFDVFVDDEDFELAALYSIARRSKGSKRFSFYQTDNRVPLHRAIFRKKLGASWNEYIGDSFLLDKNDCNLRRDNLSSASPGRLEAGTRKPPKTSASGFVGVYLNGATNTYLVDIRKNSKSYNLGQYGPDPLIAAQLYNRAAQILFGPLATLNVIPENAPKVPAKYLKRLQLALKKRGLRNQKSSVHLGSDGV